MNSLDIHRVLDAASSYDLRRGRTVLHALPTGFSLDRQQHIVDPAGMIGERLGADLHVVTSEAAAARTVRAADDATALSPREDSSDATASTDCEKRSAFAAAAETPAA